MGKKLIKETRSTAFNGKNDIIIVFPKIKSYLYIIKTAISSKLIYSPMF